MGNNQREKKGFPGWLGGAGTLIAGGIPSILKLGKFGGTLISMAVSAWAYSLVLQFPWSFSIGLVVMIFIHEMGHIWAARRKGLPVSAPAFIPFLGALIMMKKQPQDAVTEAYIAFGGPLVGTVGASLTYLVAWWTGYEVLYPVALIGFFINLFNLLPIHPLDGGRIVTAISRWLWVVGLVLGLLLVWVLKSFLLLLIWFLFAFQLWSSYLSRRRHQPRRLETTVEVDPVAFDSRGDLAAPSKGIPGSVFYPILFPGGTGACLRCVLPRDRSDPPVRGIQRGFSENPPVANRDPRD